MKQIILSFIAAIYSVVAFGQEPDLVWQNTIGSNNEDGILALEVTDDGGYIFGGWSNSGISADKSEDTLGGWDFWVVKTDEHGILVWENTIGGSEPEFITDIVKATDGGFILVGYSYSNSSPDKSENSLGENDFWVVKINDSGEIVWENTIGGSGSDAANAICVTPDGGYLVGGTSASDISFDKTENSFGLNDYWVVKINSEGETEWQNTIGGNGNDILLDLIATNDGGYLLGGYSDSDITGDKTEISYGSSSDYWIVKIDSIGNIQWQNDMGANNYEALQSVQQTNDNGYIIGGYSASGSSGDKSEGIFGGHDYWLVKTDSLGTIEWENTIGSDQYDELYAVQQTMDGGFILGGWSNSTATIDKTDPCKGLADYWIVKTDFSGNIIWQKTIGGPNNDFVNDIRETGDNEFIVGGLSYSNLAGDKTEYSKGADDFWIMKLGICEEATYYTDADGDNFGDGLKDTTACYYPTGYSADSTDCDDTNPDIFPGATEIFNGLDDDCDDLTDEGVAVNELVADCDFIIYPNPAFDILNISSSSLNKYKIEMSDIAGNILFSKDVTGTSDKESFQIDIHNFPSGIYLVKISDGMGNYFGERIAIAH